MTPWEVQGRELIDCNCSYGCPGVAIIDKGHYGYAQFARLHLNNHGLIRHRAVA